jgi:hypothetical protein
MEPCDMGQTKKKQNKNTSQYVFDRIVSFHAVEAFLSKHPKMLGESPY